MNMKIDKNYARFVSSLTGLEIFSPVEVNNTEPIGTVDPFTIIKADNKNVFNPSETVNTSKHNFGAKINYGGHHSGKYQGMHGSYF